MVTIDGHALSNEVCCEFLPKKTNVLSVHFMASVVTQDVYNHVTFVCIYSKVGGGLKFSSRSLMQRSGEQWFCTCSIFFII